MKLKRTYSSREVASLTGLTARQLQLWDASGLVAAAIPTHRTDAGGYTERRYTPIELFELLVLADLRRRGFTVHQLHEILETLRRRFGARLFDATGGGGKVQLLTDGRDIYARTDRGDFFNLLHEPTQALMVVGNEGLLKELSSTLRSRPRKRAARASGSGKSLRGRRPDGE
jgi:DNA-binding transcriptional MerR regulator